MAELSPANVDSSDILHALNDSLRELFFYHAGVQEESGLAWMTEEEFYSAARVAIARFMRCTIAATALQRKHMGWPVNEPAFCTVDSLLSIVNQLNPLLSKSK